MRGAHSSFMPRLRSSMFAPISRDAPRDASAKSHALLSRAGFIQQSAAGIYRLLPLGERVLGKLTALVDAEMQRRPLAAERLRLPLISAAELWERSGRWNKYGDELMRLQDRKGNRFCLGPTFEEEISDTLAGVRPEKDLPIKLFQITHKYRDEVRPRFGLLRGREFVMKDLYTFHASRECAERTYEQVCAAYERIFTALQLDFVKVLADPGLIGGNYTHEFQALADIGEDDLIYCDVGDFRANAETVYGMEKKIPAEPERCDRDSCSCKHQAERGTLRVKKGIEVGQAFLLGTKYSESFGVTCRSADGGKPFPVEMACYGIGVSRLMAAVIEGDRGNDKEGIIWPRVIAPFDAVIMTGPGNREAREQYAATAEEVSNAFTSRSPHLDIVLDDRWNDSFGSKFSEAKLIGYPFIIVIGKHSIGEDKVELVERATHKSEIVSVQEAIARVSEE